MKYRGWKSHVQTYVNYAVILLLHRTMLYKYIHLSSKFSFSIFELFCLGRQTMKNQLLARVPLYFQYRSGRDGANNCGAILSVSMRS